MNFKFKKIFLKNLTSTCLRIILVTHSFYLTVEGNEWLSPLSSGLFFCQKKGAKRRAPISSFPCVDQLQQPYKNTRAVCETLSVDADLLHMPFKEVPIIQGHTISKKDFSLKQINDIHKTIVRYSVKESDYQ